MEITNEIIIRIAGWIIGAVGAMLSICGVLVGYIFRRHAKDNDVQFANNREDHKIIFGKLNGRKHK